MELKLNSLQVQYLSVLRFNRTNVELKPAVVRYVLQKHLSFNRTNVELKLLCLFGICPYRLRFNRTNVELKLITTCSQSNFFIIVLIAPMWNWNGMMQSNAGRTYVPVLIAPMWNWNYSTTEKHQNTPGSFNRTNVELKHTTFCMKSNLFTRFNRTNVELKRQKKDI